MKINVSAESGNPVGLFYPVDEAPMMAAQIVAVDVCGQQSGPTTIPCHKAPSSGGGSLWVIIISFLLVYTLLFTYRTNL